MRRHFFVAGGREPERISAFKLSVLPSTESFALASNFRSRSDVL
jgi:hypothetical protein